MTTTAAQQTSTTEWGVKLTWPNGHTEVQPHRAGRENAERAVRIHNSRGDAPNRAEVVSRTVTITGWQVTS